MNKQEELKEIEEVLADLEARMAGLRKFVEEEQKKPEYKVGDILIVKGQFFHVVKVTEVGGGHIRGDYRTVLESRMGELNKNQYFDLNEYPVFERFFG